MTLYHMKNDGTPGVCSAQPGNCPLSNSSIHTHTLEEAQDFADRMNEIKALNIYEKVRLNSNNNLDNILFEGILLIMFLFHSIP